MNKLNFKNIIINTVLIFIICSIFHFIYNLIPSFVTAIFFPVNESIWEHLKLIFTSTIFYTLISNIFYKDKNTDIKELIGKAFMYRYYLKGYELSFKTIDNDEQFMEIVNN